MLVERQLIPPDGRGLVEKARAVLDRPVAHSREQRAARFCHGRTSRGLDLPLFHRRVHFPAPEFRFALAGDVAAAGKVLADQFALACAVDARLVGRAAVARPRLSHRAGATVDPIDVLRALDLFADSLGHQPPPPNRASTVSPNSRLSPSARSRLGLLWSSSMPP